MEQDKAFFLKKKKKKKTFKIYKEFALPDTLSRHFTLNKNIMYIVRK